MTKINYTSLIAFFTISAFFLFNSYCLASYTYNPTINSNNWLDDGDSINLNFNFSETFTSLDSGTLSLTLYDDQDNKWWTADDGTERAKISCNDVASNDSTWHSTIRDLDFGGTYDFNLEGSELTHLEDHSSISFKLENPGRRTFGGGDFGITQAKLELQGTAQAPIPGAAWLLGAGLLGLLGFKRIRN